MTVFAEDLRTYIVGTTAITSDDARLIQRYYATLRALRITNDLYCAGCREKCEKTVSDEKIAFACKCNIRHWSATVN